jgi:hypothetical protein
MEGNKRSLFNDLKAVNHVNEYDESEKNSVLLVKELDTCDTDKKAFFESSNKRELVILVDERGKYLRQYVRSVSDRKESV